MGDSQRMRRYRRQLFEKDNRCHYCKNPTIWETPMHGVLSPLAATIDHVFDRFDSKRYDASYKFLSLEEKYVLACSACNHRRGQKREEELKGKPQRFRFKLSDINPVISDGVKNLESVF